MKNKELFEKTINVLVKAYLDDTLRNCSCCACAVGNLLLASHNSKPVKINDSILEWPLDIPFSFNNISWYSVVFKGEIPNEGINNFNKTGYSWDELTMIENSFELKNYFSKDRMFDNMMSVVDCLMIIHEANENEIEIAKSMFVKETA